jgi:hypothetical protein
MYNSKARCHQTLLEWESNKVAVKFVLEEITKTNVIFNNSGQIPGNYFLLFIIYSSFDALFLFSPTENVFKYPMK